jgi:hypothetical protein
MLATTSWISSSSMAGAPKTINGVLFFEKDLTIDPWRFISSALGSKALRPMVLKKEIQLKKSARNSVLATGNKNRFDGCYESR